MHTLDADLLDITGVGGDAVESCDPLVVLEQVEEPLRVMARAGVIVIIVVVIMWSVVS